MLFLSLIVISVYYRRIVLFAEPFVLSPKNPYFLGYNKTINHKFDINNSILTTNINSTTDLTQPIEAEDTPPSYYNSDYYKSLSKYFNSEEKEIEDKEYSHLKDKHVKHIEGTDLFTPSTYTIESLVVLPELFHSNFLLRNEDHWEKLIKLRNKYRRKTQILEKIKDLKTKRSSLAKFFFFRESSNYELREGNVSLRNESRDLNQELDNINSEINNIKNQLPNLLSPEVPSENIVQKEFLETLRKPAEIPHYEILERLSGDYIERAVNISGRGFSAYSGDVARLSRALTNFFLDTLTKLFKYKEINVPLIVSKSTLESTGHLPSFENHLFKIDSCNLFNGEIGYLIPTSEVPLLALNKNQKIKPKDLPLWLVAYSECFRSEIQDYGLDTRGLIRQHQFGKVELVCLSDSENSDYMHQLMLSHIELLLKSLDLPYRQVLLSNKDTGFTSSKTFDFEVYFPSLKKFVEVSSCSNTRDYQSNNLNLETASNKNIHCINGSGLAIGRTLSALLENNCILRDNGLLKIEIPKSLQPYLNNQNVILEQPKT